jgi:hypothetical protein
MKLTSVVALAIVLLVAGLVIYPATHLRAQPASLSSSQYLTFGMVGIIPGQQARLNALLLPTGGPIIAGGSCEVTFTILSDQGATLASATMPVTQNQSVQFDYPALPLPIPTSGTMRTEIRGTVQVAFTMTPGSTAAAGPSCDVVPTMEIVNPTTGQTELVLENTRPIPEVIPLTAMH